MPRRTLVACLGNIFLGDDGFGVEVARRLAREELPDGTRVTDYGIRGMNLAYDLAEGWDTTILVDAAARGGEPGTVYVIEPERRPPPDGGRQAPGLAESMLLDAHGMQPDVMLAMAGTLGAEAGMVPFSGMYAALKERRFDGQSDPLGVVQSLRLYEVQRYLSLTAHWWTGFTLLAGEGHHAGGPDDVRDHEQGQRQGDRVRGPEGRPDPGREGEHHRRAVGLVLARPAARALHDLLRPGHALV